MKSKNEKSLYAPWENEEMRKRKPENKGSIPPPNRGKFRLRSKPKSKDHDFLEMYILSREKERLEKYGKTLGRRVKSISATWKEVKSTMYNTQNDKLHSIGKEGIEELLKGKKEKKTDKKKKNGNMQKVEWDY